MKNKTLLFASILACTLCFAHSTLAQDKSPKSGKATAAHHTEALTPEELLDKRLKLAKNHLSLTDQQVEQLRSVLGQNQDKLQADRKKFMAADSGSKERKVARKQLMTDRTAMMDQLKGVLSEEQLTKFRKMKLARIDEGEEHVGTARKATKAK